MGEWSVCVSGETKNLNDSSGQEVEPADVPIESETLVVMLVEPEDPGGGGILCVYLGGTQMRPGDTNHLGSRTDVSKGQADLLSTLNGTETANMSHRDSAGTYLGAGGTNCLVLEPNGFRDHADGSNACTDAHSVGNGMETPAHETESVSMHQNGWKTQNSPYMRKTETPKPAIRWRRVSVEGVDVYVPRNAPVEAPS